MAFRPLEWDAIGRALANGTTEAELRAAIGRLYYAMFGESLMALGRKGLVTPRMDGTDHGAVARALQSNKRGNASIALNNLRDLRNLADYDYGAEITGDKVQKAIAFADAITRFCSTDWAQN